VRIVFALACMQFFQAVKRVYCEFIYSFQFSFLCLNSLNENLCFLELFGIPGFGVRP